MGAIMQTTELSGQRPVRNGFSLVEMLVVVALSSLLMGVVVSLMLGLKQWDRLSRTNSTRNEQLLRLASTLRSDIRGGTDVLVSVEGPLVVMTASGEQLRYELGSEGCRRTVVAPGTADPRADFDCSGAVDSADEAIFFQHQSQACGGFVDPARRSTWGAVKLHYR